MTQKEILLNLGFFYNKNLNIYIFKNKDIDLKITLSRNLFGYYKLYFDIDYGLEKYKFSKWSYSLPEYFKSYIFDILNMLCIYGYLINNFKNINIKNIYQNFVFDISANNDKYKIRFTAIDNIFKNGIKSKVEHLENKLIQIIPNHKEIIQYVPIDYEIFKFVMEYQADQLENIDYSIFDSYRDKVSKNLDNIRLDYDLSNKDCNLFHYKFNTLYSKNYFCNEIDIDFHIIENKHSKASIFLFQVRAEKFISLSNFNYKIIINLIDLTQKHIFLKY